MDVHDTAVIPRSIPLEPGMVITIEPGNWKNMSNNTFVSPAAWRLVDRLGSRLWGYHPVTPRPISCRPFVHHLLVPPIISRGAPCQATWETSVSEGWNYGWEMAGQFGPWFRLPHKSQGSFTCRKSVTWDRQLYFPSKGRHAVYFFVWKIRQLRPGSNPQSLLPETSMLTTKLLKLLAWRLSEGRAASHITKLYSYEMCTATEIGGLLLCLLNRWAVKLTAVAYHG
jgi:hypothetical protein